MADEPHPRFTTSLYSHPTIMRVPTAEILAIFLATGQFSDPSRRK